MGIHSLSQTMNINYLISVFVILMTGLCVGVTLILVFYDGLMDCLLGVSFSCYNS